jgi:hypothetical protein
MAHPTKDKSADLPKHCYSEIISIFHFTWAKSNEIPVLKEYLSSTAHNFSAPRQEKKVMTAVVWNLRSKGAW